MRACRCLANNAGTGTRSFGTFGSAVHSATGPSSPLAPLRDRGFAGLWRAQVWATVGDALVDLSAAILVFRVTGSAAAVGLLLLVSALPTVLVGLVSGVLIDRVDRVRVMIGANLARAVFVLALPWLAAYDLALLFVGVALVSAVGQVFDPAHESLVPDAVDRERLTAANALTGISDVAAIAVGFAAAGVLTEWLPIGAVFVIAALCFASSAAAVTLVRVPAVERPAADSSLTAVRENLREGFATLLGDPALRAALLLGAPVAALLGLWHAVLLPLVIRTLGEGEAVYGLLQAVMVVGFVAISLALPRLFDRMSEGQWLSLGLVAMAMAAALLGMAPQFAPAVLAVLVFGVGSALVALAQRALVQRNTARDVRGRVFATLLVARDAAYVLGMGAAGLADLVPPSVVVLMIAAAAAACAVAAGMLPGLRRSAAAWRRGLRLLRAATAPAATLRERAATAADLERLAALLGPGAGLDPTMRARLADETVVVEAPVGTPIVRRGDESDAAFVLIAGQAVAGWEERGAYRVLERLSPGDVFGEISALTGAPRTATVVASEDALLLEVPAPLLARWAEDATWRGTLLSIMDARLERMGMAHLSLRAGLDAASRQALRSARERPL